LTSAKINRNPTRLPSDVQLVTAVDKYHGIFQNYRNVIICSIRGDVSFASKLAGGGETFLMHFFGVFSEKITDYDGGKPLP